MNSRSINLVINLFPLQSGGIDNIRPKRALRDTKHTTLGGKSGRDGLLCDVAGKALLGTTLRSIRWYKTVSVLGTVGISQDTEIGLEFLRANQSQGASSLGSIPTKR